MLLRYENHFTKNYDCFKIKTVCFELTTLLDNTTALCFCLAI